MNNIRLAYVYKTSGNTVRLATMSIAIKTFSIDLYIEEKGREFADAKEKVKEWMVMQEVLFDQQMREYKRKHIEREELYAQQMKELLRIEGILNEGYKSNSNTSQRLRMIARAKRDIEEAESKKETQRIMVSYKDSPFVNNFPFFEVKYETQPDYTKKVAPVRKVLQETERGHRMVYGCDSDNSGNVYMADRTNNQVYIVNKQNGKILKPMGAGTVSKPWGVKCNKGFVYVTEPDSGRLCVFNKKGDLHYIKRFDARGYNPRMCSSKPAGIDVDKEGKVYIADTGQKKIHILDPKCLVSEVGIQSQSLVSPQDVKVIGDKIYVLDGDAFLVKVFDREGRLIDSLVPNVDKHSPEFFAVDKFGNILICNQKMHCVQIYDNHGHFIHQIPCGLSYPGGIAVKKNGEITLTCLGEDYLNIF